MNERSPVALAAALVVAGALGGALALGGAWLAGGFDGNTTTVREVSGPSAAEASFEQDASLSLREIYQRSAPGVVQISTRSETLSTDPFSFGSPQVQEGLGSGFVYDKAGHIVTNFHVVRGANSIRLSFSNKDSKADPVVGTDPSTDIAVLKVNAESAALTHVPLGNCDALPVGD